tara:strand:- start:170 stop:397 length:228 start_codon:yes stop_codon:yes gene_type:complete
MQQAQAMQQAYAAQQAQQALAQQQAFAMQQAYAAQQAPQPFGFAGYSQAAPLSAVQPAARVPAAPNDEFMIEELD